MRLIPLMAVSTLIIFGAGACGGDGGGVGPNTDPVANFTVAPPGTCSAGAPCQFTDSSADPDGTIASRAWDFGDPASGANNTSAEVNPVHTFSAAGTFNVSLTVTDNGGKTNNKTVAVTVTGATPGNVAPVANFDLPQGCTAGTPCGFHSTSEDSDGQIATASWNFGDPASDQNTAEGNDATHTYAAAGAYTVTLTVTDDDGATATSTQQLTVSPAASQSCTTSGTRVDCSLGMTQRVNVKITVVSEACQLAGNKLTINFPGEGEQTAFFNLCNREVGEEYIVKDATGAASRVFEPGSTLPLRFTQGPQGTNPPVSDPGIRVTGSYPNWTLNVDDGGAAGTPGEPDFNDVVLSVTATPAP